MEPTLLRRLGVVVTGLAALHCNGGPDGTYDASLANIRDDVKLTLSVAADGAGELSLPRWYGSNAYQLEHCPVIHAAASVNGRPLVLEEGGGWVPFSSGGPGLFDGTGGYCRDIRYHFAADTLKGLEGADVVFRIEDESGTMEMQTPYIVDELSIALVAPTMDTLIPGAPAEIALLPGVAALDVSRSRCSVWYTGQLAHKTLVSQWAGFEVARDPLVVTERGLGFTVPPTEDSHGMLKVDCSDGGPANAGIARCEGVPGCQATREKPRELEVEVSVSAGGTPVAPDPTFDPANWRTCWFSADLPGDAPDIALDALETCSGGLQTGASTLALTWGETTATTHTALRVTGIDALELTQEFPGELELSIDKDTWASPPGGCTVKLTRVDPDTRFEGIERYVVQGSGQCAEPLAPTPSNPLPARVVDAFQFRAGVIVSP